MIAHIYCKPGVGVGAFGAQRTPERCDSEHVVSAGTTFGWLIYGVTCKCTTGKKKVRIIIDTYWKCPAQHNEGGTRCCCHERNTLHVLLARVKLCVLPLSQTLWDRCEKQLKPRAVVTWSVHVRRMNDSVWFVSDGRWELQHREQAGYCLTSPTPDWEQWYWVPTTAKLCWMQRISRSNMLWCFTFILLVI